MLFVPAALFALASSSVALAAPAADKRGNVAIQQVPQIFSQLHAFQTQQQVIPLSINQIPPFAFNNWNQISSLNGFDNFFGVGNFDGRFNPFQVTQVLQCRANSINGVQQQLAILLESMKQVLLTQLCDVETQVLLAAQFGSHFNGFVEDLRRISGRQIGFDGLVSNQLQFVLQSIQTGQVHPSIVFNGHSVGSNLHFVSSNWDQNISPRRVHSAWVASQLALFPPQILNL